MELLVYGATSNTMSELYDKVNRLLLLADTLAAVANEASPNTAALKFTSLSNTATIGNSSPASLFIDITNNRVGIRTSSPNTGFHVAANTLFGANVTINSILNVSGATSVAGNVSVTGTSHTFSGNVNIDSGVLFIDSITNRVGINNVAPVAALHVSGDIVATGDITAFYTSDERLKKDIHRIQNALDIIDSINGVEYKLKEHEENKNKNTDLIHYGVIAQDVIKYAPYSVSERENGYLAVNYISLIPILIESIKELNTQNRCLREQLDYLEYKINDIKRE